MECKKLTRQIRKLLPLKKCGAVIVAAGNASRMKGIDKVMAPLGGEPLIVRTVRAFQQSDVISEIVVVTRQDLIGDIMELCKSFDKVSCVVAGGATRTESVLSGIGALSKGIKLVAVHDGARPFVSWEVIDRTVRAANTYGAAAPGVPVKDTVKVVKGGLVDHTPDRADLQAIQTPQVFDRDILMGALHSAEEKGYLVTDDCSAVEKIGMSVKIVIGDERNLKITTPLDLVIGECLLEDIK